MKSRSTLSAIAIAVAVLSGTSSAQDQTQVPSVDEYSQWIFNFPRTQASANDPGIRQCYSKLNSCFVSGWAFHLEPR